MLFCEELDRLVVRGDDFVLLGEVGAFDRLHELLKTECTVKLVTGVGGSNREQEAVILNQVVRNVPKVADGRMAVELEPDQRHVEGLLTELKWPDD